MLSALKMRLNGFAREGSRRSLCGRQYKFTTQNEKKPHANERADLFILITSKKWWKIYATDSNEKILYLAYRQSLLEEPGSVTYKTSFLCLSNHPASVNINRRLIFRPLLVTIQFFTVNIFNLHRYFKRKFSISSYAIFGIGFKHLLQY
jgi:hypothetical protein